MPPVLRVLALILSAVAPAAAQVATNLPFGQTVAAVQFEVQGRAGAAPPNEASLRDLVDVRVGEPLTQEAVRSSMDHLFTLGQYDDIRPFATPGPNGLVVTFRLLPRYPIERVQVASEDPGVSVGPLTDELTQRFTGRQPAAVRTEVVEEAVVRYLNDAGYLVPDVSATVVVPPGADAATLLVTLRAGPLATIAATAVENTSPFTDEEVLRRLDAAPGRPYQRRLIETRLTELEDALRLRGYYEAQATFDVSPSPAGVSLRVGLVAGPLVELRVEPAGVLPGSADDLIPIERQRSADQDLLEDARANIERALRRQGYATAAAPFTRTLSDDGAILTVTFRIDRGARYFVDRVDLPAGLQMPEAILRERLGIRAGEVFDQERVDLGLRNVIDEYRRRGHYEALAEPSIERVPERSTSEEAWIILHPEITEGPRGVIAAVTFAFEGPHLVTEETLRRAMRSTPGAPYVELDAVLDQDGLRTFYRDRGFLSAAVALSRVVDAAGTGVELVYAVNEGPQIIINRISVLGNARVSEQQILEEMRLVPGQPLGLSALTVARQRLADMGVFRSFTVEVADRIGGETDGHVIVTVTEASAITVGFGLGLEGGSRARRAEDGSAIEDRIEIAPRGFFEVTRRHLGGRNRAVSFFSRVGLRRSDRENLSETVQEFQFTEYRVTGTFREQHALRWDMDLLVSVTSEQSVRPTYNYLRRAINAEFLRRLGTRATLSGRYLLDFTRLFDERIPEDDQPLIDRLFPQVRLSVLSTGAFWDGRDSPLAPTRGTFLSADLEVAVRALASEVGYLKTFLQASNFRRLGAGARTVLAFRGQLGLARGFPRTVPGTDIDGRPTVQVLRDLPVSQRFFAGGGTTVRGFPLDRLGVFDPDCAPCSVLNPTTGLSIGGNAMVVLNAEARHALTRLFGRSLAVVGFLDGGNVFPNATDFDLMKIRGGTGFGVRYDSPLGPLRFDVGFKLDRLQIGERRESRWEYHLSIGEAF